MTPSDVASACSPPSTRAASESGDETETEADASDEHMSSASGDEDTSADVHRGRRRRQSAVGMDLDG